MDAARQLNQENQDYHEQHDYPFHGSKHMNPVSINHDLVRMSRRTQNDFDSVTLTKPKTRTNYEAYKSVNSDKCETKTLFQNDPDRQRVVKMSADY